MTDSGKSRRKRFLVNILVSLLTFALLFGIAEISCRLFWEEEITIEEMDETLLYTSFTDSEGTGYMIKDGLIYTTDGMISEEDYNVFFLPDNYSRKKSENIFRIIVLGDSFTAEDGLMDHDESFTEMLFKSLNSWPKKEKYQIDGFEIFPLCYGGLNTLQELTLLNEIGLDYNPDMVILQYCDNDITKLRAEIDFGFKKIKDSSKDIFLNPDIEYIIVDRNTLIPRLPVINNAAGDFLLAKSHFMRFVSYRTNSILFFSETTPKESLDSLVKIDRLTDKKGIPFIIMIFSPAFPNIDLCRENSGWFGRRLHKEVSMLAKEMHVPYYSMCDYVENILDIKSELPGDAHYNEEGHRIAAEVLRDAVIREVVNNG